MSLTEIERLARDYRTDQALRGKIDGADDTGKAAHVARAAGYDGTAEEVKAEFAGQDDNAAELTGQQLDAVAGGLPSGLALRIG